MRLVKHHCVVEVMTFLQTLVCYLSQKRFATGYKYNYDQASVATNKKIYKTQFSPIGSLYFTLIAINVSAEYNYPLHYSHYIIDNNAFLTCQCIETNKLNNLFNMH